MRKFFFLLAALMVTTSVMSENPMSFTVNGPEERYNQIKVVNHTSYSNFECRVFALNEDDSVGELYGIYNLKGYDDPADYESKKELYRLIQNNRKNRSMPKSHK